MRLRPFPKMRSMFCPATSSMLGRKRLSLGPYTWQAAPGEKEASAAFVRRRNPEDSPT